MVAPDHDQAVQRLTYLVRNYPDMPGHHCVQPTLNTLRGVLAALTAETEARKSAEARATKALDACRLALAYVEKHDTTPWCDYPNALADEADAVEEACRAALAGEGGRR